MVLLHGEFNKQDRSKAINHGPNAVFNLIGLEHDYNLRYITRPGMVQTQNMLIYYLSIFSIFVKLPGAL